MFQATQRLALLLGLFALLSGCLGQDHKDPRDANFAEVEIITQPPGAILSLNGEPIGNTPLKIRLEKSRQRVELNLQRNGTWPYTTELVQPASGWPASLSFTLDPKPAGN